MKLAPAKRIAGLLLFTAFLSPAATFAGKGDGDPPAAAGSDSSDAGTTVSAPGAAGAAGFTTQQAAKPNPVLGSPSGSAFGRIGPYDLARPERRSIWPQVRLGLGVRHLEKEGGSTESLNFARFGTQASIYKLSFGAELDVLFNDDGEIVDDYYDDISDYLSVLKYVEWGSPGETVYARGGVIADATIGHGTLVGHYYNNTLLEKQKFGIASEINLRVLSAQFLMNDAVDYSFAAGRVAYKPIMDTGIPFVREVAVGTSFALDRNAPDQLKTIDGDRVFQINDDDEIRASREQLYAYGFDVELPIFSNSWMTLVPYADQNFINAAGNGFHAGVYTRFRVPLHIPVNVSLKAEWRRFNDKYLPTYFDAFYEFERFHYPRVDSATTKLQALRRARLSDGMLYELSFDVAQSFQFGAVYEDNDHNFTDRVDLFAAFTGLTWMSVRAHYQKRGFEDLTDLTDINEQTFISTQALVQIYGYLYADLRWTRYWEVNKGNGRYRAVDVYEPGLAVIFQF